MAMKIQVVVMWVVTPCNDVVGYRRFGGPCCFHLQVVTTCSDVGYQRFGRPWYLRLLALTPCYDVVKH